MAVVATDRLFRGVRTKDRTAVTVHLAPGESHPLAPDEPARFDWGRPTDGARALADALATEVFAGDATPGLRERLFHEIVLRLPFLDPWLLWRHDLLEW